MIQIPSTEALLLLAVALAGVAALAGVVLVLRRPADPSPMLAELGHAQSEALARQASALRELELSLIEHAARQAAQGRAELAGSIDRFGDALTRHAASLAALQNARLDGFANQLARLTDANEQRLAEIRATLEHRLRELQSDNGTRLEEMRRTVDEKLHATLEQRLGESFRQVSDRLEQVHRGLGEMRVLASDVGDLKRVLSNVKTRGTWGEVQLGALLEQMLVAGQFAANVATVPGSTERVEFAIRLPGAAPDAPVWLPVDAKFPREDYERLLAAQEQADAAGAEAAARQLEARLRAEARTIREKYVSPPATTDFGLLFLPVEGLYAEALRRPGLVDELQRRHRVVVAGPTTLAAILSSLQMGFRTLAVEQRSSEVWQLLGAVKTEFGKFGDVLAKTRRQLDQASTTLGGYEVRTRAIERRLRSVEQLPDAAARRLLDDGADGAEASAPGAAGDAAQAPDAEPGAAGRLHSAIDSTNEEH